MYAYIWFVILITATFQIYPKVCNVLSVRHLRRTIEWNSLWRYIRPTLGSPVEQYGADAGASCWQNIWGSPLLFPFHPLFLTLHSPVAALPKNPAIGPRGTLLGPPASSEAEFRPQTHSDAYGSQNAPRGTILRS